MTVADPTHPNPHRGRVRRWAEKAVGADEAARWAMTPDELDRSTWRLPLYGEDGKPHPRRVAYALGRLSPDADPGIPPKAMDTARRRIAAAWRAMHGPDAELPRPLRERKPAAKAHVLTKAADGWTVNLDLLAKADTFVGDSMAGGVMVALGVSPEAADALAITSPPDGVEVQPREQLHLTLCYMGKIEEWPSDMLDNLDAAVRRWAVLGAVAPIEASVVGAIMFDGHDTAAALVEGEGLADECDALCDYLECCGMEEAGGHDAFLPHISLAYGAPDALRQLPPPPMVPLTFDTILVVAGDRVTRVPLDGDRAMQMMAMGPDTMAMSAVRKDDTKRYTLMPLYAPGKDDSHGEWATADTLQAAVWSYMEKGDFTVNLQHVPGTTAGRCVEVVSWPFEHTAKMVNADGAESDVTFPPGTIFQGVVWEPWAFDRVLRGEITGLSLEGTAYRVRS